MTNIHQLPSPRHCGYESDGITPRARNSVGTYDTRAAAICEFCGRKSKFTDVNEHGEPDLWKMGRGWSEAPYPADSQHDDGSTGSKYTCPACNKRLRSGESLETRAYLRGTKPETAVAYGRKIG